MHLAVGGGMSTLASTSGPYRLAPFKNSSALCNGCFCTKLWYNVQNDISNGSEHSNLHEMLNDDTVGAAIGFKMCENSPRDGVHTANSSHDSRSLPAHAAYKIIFETHLNVLRVVSESPIAAWEDQLTRTFADLFSPFLSDIRGPLPGKRSCKSFNLPLRVNS
jgi:hypothetical protein